MVAVDGRRALIHGFRWGVLAGLVLVALMYLANLLLGLQPLTQALNEPLLAIMPGFVFGFLIDTLQHAGKVVEELGLIVAMVVALGLLGAAWAWTSRRWRFPYSALVFAGAGWLVVTGLLLPIAGEGVFGLTTGPTTPLVWAALFAVYGVVLQLGGDPGDEPADPGRRRLLSALPLGLGAISLGVLALKLAPNWYGAIFSPPEAGLYGRSPQLTPIENFYIVSKNLGGDPNIDGGSWRLKIGGLASNPVTLTVQDLRALPATSEYVTLECISNLVGGSLMSTGIFTGVALRYLLQQAGPKSSASWAGFKAADGYTESLPLSAIDSDPTILVAYELDGDPLPAEHGYPARILIPGRYGMKGPKWLTEIDLLDHETGGYWEQQGWDHHAVVRTTSRIDLPREGDIVKVSGVSVSGVAFAGTRGINKVEVSTDGGRSWVDAPFTAPLSPLTWVLWNFNWTPPGEGSYDLVVRATDGTGAVQESKSAMSYPSGATGYHSVRVDVSK
ncbi:MAG TPA: molybdopterin-dependent oxidoreductase [Candidatus Dormibacteraeota bacterium]|nr:molybdopterin-dependent oxidoreductase [Candidatus Dormibacteraeota bacterium]